MIAKFISENKIFLSKGRESSVSRFGEYEAFGAPDVERVGLVEEDEFGHGRKLGRGSPVVAAHLP